MLELTAIVKERLKVLLVPALPECAQRLQFHLRRIKHAGNIKEDALQMELGALLYRHAQTPSNKSVVKALKVVLGITFVYQAQTVQTIQL